MKAILPAKWEPRGYQRPLWDYLERGGRRADVVAHRRWGKDEVALNWAASRAVAEPGTYWHLLPEASQGRKAIWDAVNPHSGRRRVDEAFPKSIRSRTRDAEMMLHLKKGSTWQVVGSDNFNSLMGSPPRGVVFSEWSLAKPDAWSFIRPILAENGGWALFLWTPRGRGHATRAFEARARDPEWFTLRSPATQTDVFTLDQLAKERAELVAELGSEEEGHARYASEYLVDFDAAAPGAYYAGLLSEAERDGRIGRVPYDPALRVDTAWDLGIDDYTAVWFFQQAGREVRAIDYFETAGEGLQAVVRRAIADKPYVYGTHHLPHDVMVRELGAAGRSRFETLGGLGVAPISVGAAMDPEERINAGRLMVPYLVRPADAASGADEARRRLRSGVAAMNLRLILIVAAVLAVLAAASGLYLKGRHDAAARERPKTEAALAKAAVAGLETQGAQQSAQRVEVVVRQKDAANGVVARLMPDALKSEDANAPLDSARAARLRNVDDGLCVADAGLAGCTADPDAPGRPNAVPALPPARSADPG